MSSIGAPQQHKQSSRKGRRAWRKNVDITEVQDGLETLREEIRQGGPLSEKKAEELFALDTLGSTEIKKKYNLNTSKPLKADEIITQARRSAVPAIDSRKRAASSSNTEFILGDGIYEPASKRRRADWVSRKEIERIRKKINTTSHLANHTTSTLSTIANKKNDTQDEDTPNLDLWATGPQPQPLKHKEAQLKELEYIPKPRAKVAPSTIRRAPVAMTASGRPVRAVRNPGAGTSYNPVYEEWENLLNQEGEKEVAAEARRLQQAEAEAEKQARIEAAAAEADKHDNDFYSQVEYGSEWEGFETENENGTDNESAKTKKKQPRRKTPAERNRIARRKEAERKTKHETKTGMGVVDQKRNTVVAANPSTKNSVTASTAIGIDSVANPSNVEAGSAEDETDEGEQNEDDDEEGNTLRRRRMGNMLIPSSNLELVLPDELRESLRQLKPEGNLLQDRFRHLLVNGKIEARKPVLQPKKKKVKYTEKWSHKDFEIKV